MLPEFLFHFYSFSRPSKNKCAFFEILTVNSLVYFWPKTWFGSKFRKMLMCCCSALNNYKKIKRSSGSTYSQQFGLLLTENLIWKQSSKKCAFVFARPWQTIRMKEDVWKHLQSTVWFTFDRTLDLEANFEKCAFVFARPWKTIKMKEDFWKHLQSTGWFTFDRQLDLEAIFQKCAFVFARPCTGFLEALTVNSLVYFWQKTWFGSKFRKMRICFCPALNNYKK